MTPFRSLQVTTTVALLLLAAADPCTAFVPNVFRHSSSSTSTLSVATSSPEEALERTASQLGRLKQRQNDSKEEAPEFDRIYQEYLMQPANVLKMELKARHLQQKGRKPDLAKRLTESDLQQLPDRITTTSLVGLVNNGSDQPVKDSWAKKSSPEEDSIISSDTAASLPPMKRFCGLPLSKAAGMALAKAQFTEPSPIQQSSIPYQNRGESLILHAETGSGKTLAYLLPITEQLWLEHNAQVSDDAGYGFILTPTRELAAQVAGVASVLAPPGTVRMVSHPTNLCSDGVKDRGEEAFGGRLDKGDGRTTARLFVGSAKAIHHSLYGDGKMPASPTTKPEAMDLLTNTRWLVLDEVDRLLNVVGKAKSNVNTKKAHHRHEKPAAIVTSAIARLTLGRAQVISASATVGRPLKREMSRVLGLGPKEHPTVIRGGDQAEELELDDEEDDAGSESDSRHVGRAVTIPDTVKHYVVPVDTSSVGKLLTSAFFVLKSLHNGTNGKKNKILLVLTRGCGINTKTAIGALKHFRCQPEPMDLLDALEGDGGTDSMIEKHRLVSGATGIGESSYFQSGSEDTRNKEESTESEEPGYLLVTGEDTVRGLHLDGLDLVVVVGRAAGPDEYTHIAGRTGRAGRQGKVINVLSLPHAAAVSGWERMLGVQFEQLDDPKDVEKL